MATTAQVLANRENAQHSTGPRSEAGKAICAANAVRHNLTARGLIVPVGFESAFESCERNLRTGLVPNGGLEEIIFARILECAWNLQRCRLAQAQLFEQTSAGALDPLLDDRLEPKFARIDKYARQYENSMFKSMRELGKLQTEAQYRDEIHPLTEEESEDPELFDSTPQSLSAVCEFRKIQAASLKQIPLQNRANSERAMDLLERITAPPSLDDEALDAMLAKRVA